MHVGGADLHLDLLFARLSESHSSVDALVAIGLGGGEVVLEAAGDDGEGAKGGVAELAARHDYAERHDVGELFESDVRRCIFSQMEKGDFSRSVTLTGAPPCSVQMRISSLRTSSMTSTP